MVNKIEDRSRDRARQDYLKAIYQIGGGRPAKSADVARYLNVTRASVCKLVRMLRREHLVEPTSRGEALQLTARGRRLAVGVVWRHRLVETFLHGALKVPLDRLHGEAERIEHALSNDVATRLARFLGNPDVDPHGDPIPGRGKREKTVRDRPIASARAGQRVLVTRIADRDPAAVRALARAGILPGAAATVISVGARVLRLRRGSRLIALRPNVAAAVRVEVARRLPSR